MCAYCFWGKIHPVWLLDHVHLLNLGFLGFFLYFPSFHANLIHFPHFCTIWCKITLRIYLKISSFSTLCIYSILCVYFSLFSYYWKKWPKNFRLRRPGLFLLFLHKNSSVYFQNVLGQSKVVFQYEPLSNKLDFLWFQTDSKSVKGRHIWLHFKPLYSNSFPKYCKFAYCSS